VKFPSTDLLTKGSRPAFQHGYPDYCTETNSLSHYPMCAYMYIYAYM